MKLMTFKDTIPLLAGPIKKNKLYFNEEGYLEDKSAQERFPILSQKSPLLFPAEILPYCKQNGIEWKSIIDSKNPLFQFFGLSYIKWSGGEHNSSPDEPCYLEYLSNFSKLVKTARGKVLDIGCDDPDNTLSSFYHDIEYLGLDPLYYLKNNKFKIFALAEFLPFQNEVFDNVCFGTSLDHAFDPFTAINESYRVLKIGGSLYLSTLIWSKNAELYNDSVHFHHFREKQLFNMLEEAKFCIKGFFKTSWKNNSYRQVLFLQADKIV